MQEYSHCGAGNPNEPLVKVLFFNADMYAKKANNTITADDINAIDFTQYSVTFTPHFQSLGGIPELGSLKAYVMLYPQNVHDKDDATANYWEKSNPYRGKISNGNFHGNGANNENNAVDLSIFDYRSPLLTSNQTVFYLGEVTTGAVDGQQYTVQINETVNRQLRQAFVQAMNDVSDNMATTNMLRMLDPRFYIIITADINDAAMQGTANGADFELNAVGATVEGVTVYDAKGAVAYPTSSQGIRYAAVLNDEKVRPANSDMSNTSGLAFCQFYDVDAQERTRHIMLRRKLMFMPYQGYSKFYRIPGLSDLEDGTLVVTADARKYHNHDVRNNFDVMSRVSFDYGRTWEDSHVIAEGQGTHNGGVDGAYCHDNNVTKGYGDAAVCDLRTPGHVLATFIGGAGLRGNDGGGPKIYYAVSTTNGQSWNEPKLIPQELYLTDGDQSKVVACPGPGRMHQIVGGPNDGKILMCAYLWEGDEATNGPLNIFAYDEGTDTWSRVAALGKVGGYGFGESQIVQLTTNAYLLSARMNSAPVRRWMLLIPGSERDADGNIVATYPPEFNSSGSGTFPTKGTGSHPWRIIQLEQGDNAFSFDAGGCNSNMTIYRDAEDGHPYLIQAMPTSKTTECGDRNGATNRSQIVVKAADLQALVEFCDIVAGNVPSNMNSWTLNRYIANPPKINWVSPGLNLSHGQATAGYSCVSAQKDGTIGIVTEEYPIAYRPAKALNCDRSDGEGNTDVLLSIWYYNTTFESITNGNVQSQTDQRMIERPVIDPDNTTFKITTDDEEGRGTFDYEACERLPHVAITVDEQKIHVLDGEQWRIEYQIYYRPASQPAESPLLNPATGEQYAGHGQYGENAIEFLLPVDAPGLMSSKDAFRVRAWVVVYNADGQEVERSLVRAATYTAVAPARKVVVHVMPYNTEVHVKMSAEYAVVPEEVYMFARPDYNIHLEAVVPEGIPANFLGYTLNPNKHPEMLSNGKLDVTDPDLLRNVTQPGNPSNKIFNAYIYDDPCQFRLRVPSLDELPGDPNDHGRIDIYAWFDAEGGLYAKADVVDAKANYSSPVEWRSDNILAEPDPKVDRLPFPQSVNNVTEGNIVVPRNEYNEFEDAAKIRVTLIPDFWTSRKSAHAVLYLFNSETGKYQAVDDEAIRGANCVDNFPGHHGAEWVDRDALAECCQFDFNVGEHLIRHHLWQGSTLGYVIVYVVDQHFTDEQMEALKASEEARLNATGRYAAAPSFYSASEPAYSYRVSYEMRDTHIATGIDDCAAQPTPSAQRYYNLQGQPVATPEPGQIYIVTQGGVASKILYR